ncbi:MAG: TrkH family potassium uptake protein [Clostridia bacterium]|nr:TrkH family potassium uptake protein [Clostridia bacterium]
MNYKMVFYNLGRVVAVEGAALLLPLITSLLYSEWTVALAFLATMGIALAIGVVFSLVFKPKDGTIYSAEGFIIVALAWVAVSLVGALPFVFSGEIPSYVDALFESISGFTTTGASILTDVEKMSHGILMWRSFTHWIGGMGVLVLVIAVTKKASERNIHIMRAEMPGPIVDKITPRSKDTAKYLYLIYVGLTVVEFILLLCGGMDVFESVIHSFGTAGTGGFSSNNSSIAEYSPYIQWVIAVFMMLFAINFNVYFLIIIGKGLNALRSRELWTYIGVVVAATGIICANIFSIYGNFGDALRHAFFQTTSVMSTTGFSTATFSEWNEVCKGILFVLMFIGGCAGSTAGGIKLTRVILMFKTTRHELKRMLHPRVERSVKFDGKKVEEKTLHGVGVYLALYVILLLIVFFLLCFDAGFSLETNFSAAVSCFNNVGPAFDQAFASYAAYSPFSKIVLSFAMLLGRLEIYPLILVFLPSTWSRNH